MGAESSVGRGPREDDRLFPDEGLGYPPLNTYPIGSDPATATPDGVLTPVISLPPAVQSSGYLNKYHELSSGTLWRGYGGGKRLRDLDAGSRR
jgi:hypothetical protein